jgi:hypothetical protein
VQPEPHYSGGLILDKSAPENVYLSRPVNGIFELEHWHTPDHGQSWQRTPITHGSQCNNVRPFLASAPGSVEKLLFWMNGNYKHFTQYNTSIRMKEIG